MNASAEIFTTVSGMLTLINSLQYWKAAPISVTV